MHEDDAKIVGMLPGRGRRRTMLAGKNRAFRLDARQRYALALFRDRYGLKSDTEALRKILEVVADSEGLPPSSAECIELFDTDPENLNRNQAIQKICERQKQAR